MAERLLFVQTNGIGNVVAALPLLRQLRARRPDLRVDFLAGVPVVAELVAAEDLVERILLRPRGRFGGLRLLASLAGRYDACLIGWRLDPRKGAFLARLSGARRRAGCTRGGPVRAYHHQLPFTLELHEVEAHLELGRFFAPDLRLEPPRLVLRPEERARARELRAELAGDAPVLGVHPGCDRANPQKRWPAAAYAATIRLLAAARPELRFWIFLGPDEHDLAPAFAGLPRTDLIHGHPIRVVAALAAECESFLNSDSGLGHVAAAVGVPVLSLFGPEDERSCRPYGPGAETLAADLHCRPCVSRVYSKLCPHRECLTLLRPEDVAARLLAMARRRRAGAGLALVQELAPAAPSP